MGTIAKDMHEGGGKGRAGKMISETSQERWG